MSILEIAAGAVLDNKVTDLHIKEGGPFWVRRQGKLLALGNDELTREQVGGLYADVTGETLEGLHSRLGERGDFDFSGSLNGTRLRGNCFLDYQGRVVLALRKLSSRIPDFSELGLPANVLQMANRSKGLVLVTGPTGSGKSTTLASMIHHLNAHRASHIITIEDPVEYVHRPIKSKIEQREVGRYLKNFQTALRASLREDPDIILIGEMRDKETISTALDAAQTGHLVFGTLHTVSARQTVDRVTSVFEGHEREWVQQVLSSVLVGVCSQVLLETREGGRRVACEVLLNDSSVAALIKEGKVGQIANVMDTGRSRGQRPLNYSLIELLKAEVITLEEALYNTYDPAGLQRDLNDEDVG